MISDHFGAVILFVFLLIFSIMKMLLNHYRIRISPNSFTGTSVSPKSHHTKIRPTWFPGQPTGLL